MGKYGGVLAAFIPIVGLAAGATLAAVEIADIAAADLLDTVCKDPIDTNFREKFKTEIPMINTLLATVTPGRFPLDKVAAGYFSNIAEFIGFAEAVNTTAERYLGARVLHEPTFAQFQFGILQPYKIHLGYVLAQNIRLRGQLADIITEIGLNRKLTERNVEDFFHVLDTMGLPAAEIPMLKELLGATDSDILDITASFYAAAAADVGFSLPDLLTDKVSISNSVQLTEFLARHCATQAFVKASLGLSSAQPGFIPEADVNLDGKVDSADLALAISQDPFHGNGCPNNK